MSPLKLYAQDYEARLKADNIPLDPSQRTTEQQQTAQMEAWAAKLPYVSIASVNADSLIGGN